MRSNQRHPFIVLTLISLSALLAFYGVNAQKKSEQDASQKETQKPAQKPNSQPAQQGEDEPVAVTPRIFAEKSSEGRAAPKSDEFGNFRPPIINNKGEVAFVSWFGAPTPNQSFGQSIFVRAADGNWRVTLQGEKAANLPKAVNSFGSQYSFNDNGDLTFIGAFDDQSQKPAPAVPTDSNDPLAAPARPMNKSIYLKSSSGLKSLLKLGEDVPAMPSHFSGFSNVSTNIQGVTAFIGMYSDPDGKGLFLIEGGKLRLVCRSGQPIGNGEEGTFSEHYYPTQINKRNEVAFLARIGDKSGIFISRPKGVELLTITGKPSPIKDTNFIGFGNRTPAISDTGEVVFVGFYGGSANHGRALFTKGDGPIKIVAQSGEQIEGSTSAFTDFEFPAINSRGDVVFLGKFGGRNHGIFIKTAKGVEKIAAVDQPVPGGAPEETFNNFAQQPSINDRGEVVFFAQTRNPKTGPGLAIFIRDEKGNLKTLVKRGEKMPK
ncbi:MAG TPA: choice-of-anchor tandem repeat NxxGxxAF-containing protein [Blastocatellia bacterium]|nr:choice-of-anchor tandem repeat NxxGxxAF-containing protein [Blastocatellia bacterium]